VGARLNIYIHNSHDLGITYNNIAYSDNSGVYLNDDGIDPEDVYNINMTNNVIGWVPDGTNLSQSLRMRWNPPPSASTGCTYANNYHLKYGDNIAFYEDVLMRQYTTGVGDEFFNLPQWQADAGSSSEDTAAIDMTIALTPDDSIFFYQYNFSDTNLVITDSLWSGYYFYEPDGATVTSKTLSPYEHTLLIASQVAQEVPRFFINSVDTNVTCNGADDGKIYSTTSGGVRPITYAWTGPNSFTSTDSILSSLEPGTYNLTITDAEDSTGTYQTAITEPDALSVIGSVNNTTPGESNGSVSIFPDGGTTPYSYDWTSSSGGFNETTQNINNLDSAYYYLQMTDVNLCVLYDTFRVDTASGGGGGGSDTLKINMANGTDVYSQYDANVPLGDDTPISLGNGYYIIPETVAGFGGNNGMTGSTIFPDTVCRSYHYNESYDFYYDLVLDSGSVYSFDFFGSRNSIVGS
jgi:hypothetical protein